MNPRLRGAGGGWLLLGAAACGGGGSDVTNPPPVTVASVEVAPATLPLATGDTSRLVATARTSSGAALSGKAVAWSSSAPSVATVSTSGLVTAVGAGNATITAAVDGKSGSAAVTVTAPVPLELEAAAARVDSIGPAGGTLTATGSTGIAYRLTIPPNALQRKQRITMTPVRAIRTLPFSGGVVGAVDLQPQGLRFAIPARLRISANTTAPNGKRLVAFSYEQQGDSLAPVVAADSGTSVTLLLSHFSGGGAAFGTSLEISSFLTSNLTTLQGSSLYINQLVQIMVGTPNFQAELQIMRDWFNNLIIPEIQNAQNDFALILAVSDYNLALATVLPSLGVPASSVLGPERAAAGAAAAPKLRAAIDGNNAICAQDKDLVAAANALFWQTVATDFGVDTQAEQLDRATVLDQLCIQVMITKSDYPNPALAGQAGTLDVRAGLKFGTDPNLDLQPFNWKVTVTGSSSDGTSSGLADATGAFQRSITPTGNASLTILVTMCLQNNAVPYLDVCGDSTVVRGFVPPSVATSSLPNATVGTAYSTTLSAAGGAGGYLWSLLSGALPGGLSLSPGGVISGTPVAAGVFTFTVRVTSNGQSATRQLTLTVSLVTWQLSIFFQVSSGPTSGSWQPTFNFVLGSQPHLQLSITSAPSSQNVTPPLFFSGIFNANVGTDGSGEPVLSGVTIAGPTLTFEHNGTLEACQDDDIVLPAPMVTLFGGTLFSGNFPPIVGHCNITYTGLRLERIAP